MAVQIMLPRGRNNNPLNIRLNPDKAQIDAALVRAGVMPPQRSLQQTRTVKSGQVAAAGTIGAGAIGAFRRRSARRTTRSPVSYRTSTRRSGDSSRSR